MERWKLDAGVATRKYGGWGYRVLEANSECGDVEVWRSGALAACRRGGMDVSRSGVSP